MRDPRLVRRELLARFLHIAQAGSLGAAVVAGCSRSGMDTYTAGFSATSSSTGAGDGGSTAAAGGGGQGAGGGGGGVVTSSGSGGGGGAGGSVGCDGGGGAAGGPLGEMQCYEPGGAACATSSEMQGTFWGCTVWGTQVDVVYCGPFLEGTQCCYYVELSPFGCYVGRAFLVDEGLVKAGLRAGDGWRSGEAPSADGMSAATRRALADGWLLDGLFEHASVASFSRFSMQLLAVGAPASLVRQAHAAALDEIRHAELCFTLASAYAGEPLEPERFPLSPALAVDTDLVPVAVESVIEGCIGETLAAAQAAEALARATDPAVVAALTSTLTDEIRHAELAWRFVAWAVDAGGERVRATVAHAFANFRPPDPPAEDLDGVCRAAFAAHGRLTAGEARATALAAIREIVQPCACALLSRAAPGRDPEAPGPLTAGSAIARRATPSIVG